MKQILVVLIVIMLFSACTSSRRSLPVVSRYHSIHSASQQKVLSEAIDMAINQLQFPELNGKRMTCEISAVMPHSDEELNDYIRAKVEGKLASKGAMILDKSITFEKKDYLCQITISVSGADILVAKEVASKGRITANVFLQFPTLFTSWIWYPVVVKTRHYIGQSKLSVQLLPQAQDNIYVQTEGQGEYSLPFDGEDVDFYPLVEGNAYQKNSDKKINYNTSSEKRVYKPENRQPSE